MIDRRTLFATAAAAAAAAALPLKRPWSTPRIGEVAFDSNGDPYPAWRVSRRVIEENEHANGMAERIAAEFFR